MGGRQRRSFLRTTIKRQAVDLVTSSGQLRRIGGQGNLACAIPQLRLLGVSNVGPVESRRRRRGAPQRRHACRRRIMRLRSLPFTTKRTSGCRMERYIYFFNRSRSLLEFGHEVPFHRRSPGRLPVTIMCDVLGVSSAGYYAWRPRARRSPAIRRQS